MDYNSKFLIVLMRLHKYILLHRGYPYGKCSKGLLQEKRDIQMQVSN